MLLSLLSLLSLLNLVSVSPLRSGRPDVPRGAVMIFCAEHGISRETFYAIKRRALEEGQAAALEPRTRQPWSSPNRTDDAVKAQAIGTAEGRSYTCQVRPKVQPQRPTPWPATVLRDGVRITRIRDDGTVFVPWIRFHVSGTLAYLVETDASLLVFDDQGTRLIEHPWREPGTKTLAAAGRRGHAEHAKHRNCPATLRDGDSSCCGHVVPEQGSSVRAERQRRDRSVDNCGEHRSVVVDGYLECATQDEPHQRGMHHHECRSFRPLRRNLQQRWPNPIECSYTGFPARQRRMPWTPVKCIERARDCSAHLGRRQVLTATEVNLPKAGINLHRLPESARRRRCCDYRPREIGGVDRGDGLCAGPTSQTICLRESRFREGDIG